MKFHWFLPTNGGDGRHVVSGGHAQHDDPAPYDAWLATARPQLGRQTATDLQVVSA